MFRLKYGFDYAKRNPPAEKQPRPIRNEFLFYKLYHI